LTDNPRTRALLHHLAGRPGHDEVKSDFRQLLVEEFGVELGALDFERRVPEVRGRLDALIGRTVFEAKRNLDQEWEDVVRRSTSFLPMGIRASIVRIEWNENPGYWLSTSRPMCREVYFYFLVGPFRGLWWILLLSSHAGSVMGIANPFSSFARIASSRCIPRQR